MEDRTVSNETEVIMSQMIREADEAIKEGNRKKPILSSFVEEGTFKTVKALASAEGRSVSYIVKQAVLEYLQRRSMSNEDTGRILRKRQILDVLEYIQRQSMSNVDTDPIIRKRSIVLED